MLFSPGGYTTKKTPITGRINPDLARQIKDRAEAAGKSKTAILEEALEMYFRDGQAGECITGQAPAVSLESVDSIRDVIREEVREALETFRDVIQKNGRDTSVIHGRKEAPKRPKAPNPGSPGDLGKLEEAADLVARVMQIKEAEGLTMREACKRAGTSWPTFSRKRKALEEQEKDREKEDKEEAKI